MRDIKDGHFSTSSFIWLWSSLGLPFFHVRFVWKPLGSHLKKRGRSLAEASSFQEKGKRRLITFFIGIMVDHLLIHCSKDPYVGFDFSHFGVSWTFLSSPREILLFWHGFLVGKRWHTPFHIMGNLVKISCLVFDNVAISVNRCNILSL